MKVGGYGSNPVAESLARRSRVLKILVLWFYPPMPAINIMPEAVISKVRSALFRPDTTIVNVGSGKNKGCGRRLWLSANKADCRVFHMDMFAAPQMDFLADAHKLPFADESVDGVILQAVLEHVRNPRQVISEANRVLRPGGYFYIEMPFLQGYHADPNDFQRYTLGGLRERLSEFEEIESGVSAGPFCALNWILRDGLSSCFSNPYVSTASRFFAGWFLSPIRYLDYLLRGNRVATRLACEYYFLCRKRVAS